MQGMALSLSALLLIVVVTKASAAQDAARRAPRCAASFDCPQYEAFSEAQARQSSGHRTAASPESPPGPAVTSDSQPTWNEDPSLMDLSWRRWPSLTDF